jgi:hypothetical protein
LGENQLNSGQRVGGTCEAADDPVCMPGKNESQDPEFEKEDLSYLMSWKNLSENFRAILKLSRFSKYQRARSFTVSLTDARVERLA